MYEYLIGLAVTIGFSGMVAMLHGFSINRFLAGVIICTAVLIWVGVFPVVAIVFSVLAIVAMIWGGMT